MTAPPSPDRSLADDPAFQTSLSALDRHVPALEPRRTLGAAARSLASPRRRPLLELSPVDGPSSRSTPPSRDELFYGLEAHAFGPSSDPRFLHSAASHDRVLGALVDAVRRRDGVVLLIGVAGLGKTTLCRALIEHLDRGTIASVVTHPFLSIEELLKTALVDFGVIADRDLASGHLSGASHVELAGAVHHFVCSLAPLGGCAVLIIDDAHAIPVEVLGQIQDLADLERGAGLLQVVLVGRPELDGTLARPECEPLARRIRTRAELGPMTRADLSGYVSHRLAVAGTRATVSFDEEACGRLYDLSGGVPRTLNQLCDRALKYGHQRSAAVIDRAIVDRAGRALGLSASAVVRPAWQKAAIAGGLTLLALVGAALATLVIRTKLWTLLN